jgi:hypothetical protein
VDHDDVASLKTDLERAGGRGFAFGALPPGVHVAGLAANRDVPAVGHTSISLSPSKRSSLIVSVWPPRPARPENGTIATVAPGAQAPPTLPDATPAPSAPRRAAPCGLVRPVGRSGSSKARRAPPCISGRSAQASHVQLNGRVAAAVGPPPSPAAGARRRMARWAPLLQPCRAITQQGPPALLILDDSRSVRGSKPGSTGAATRAAVVSPGGSPWVLVDMMPITEMTCI